jgi:hypothetical protein
LALLLLACTPATVAYGPALRSRAAVDLHCNETFFVETIDNKTASVKGCGRNAIYRIDAQGTWVMQSAGGP